MIQVSMPAFVILWGAAAFTSGFLMARVDRLSLANARDAIRETWDNDWTAGALTFLAAFVVFLLIFGLLLPFGV